MRIRLPWELQSRLENFFESPCEQQLIPAYGGSITDKLIGTFRVATQNINGMKLGSVYSGAEEIDAMDHLGIDVLGLVETNLKWNKKERQH